MPYSEDVKQLAYTLDPACWVSYSGKPRNYKAVMDGRRTRALDQAQGQIDEVIERRRGSRSVGSLMEEPLDNFMVEIINNDGCRRVEYSDSVNLGDDVMRWINDGMVVKRITITPN